MEVHSDMILASSSLSCCQNKAQTTMGSFAAVVVSTSIFFFLYLEVYRFFFSSPFKGSDFIRTYSVILLSLQ